MGRDVPNHQNLVLFVRTDGSYVPLTAALDKDYVGLVGRDDPGLVDAGFMITLRLDVNRPSRPP